jgi:hypothetical protein
MIAMLRRVRARVPNVALGVIIGLLVGGGAYAAAQTAKPEGAGVHGGPKARFHDARECNLVDVRQLEGNWTHGDYVSAVEKKDPSKVREAAHSRCGKPNHAGRGPKDKQKSTESSTAKPKPSPRPSTPARRPSPTPSATGSASPVVPLETSSPSTAPSSSPTAQGSP